MNNNSNNKEKTDFLNSYTVPELSNLSKLSSSIEHRENQIASNISSLQSGLQSTFSFLLNHLKIEELESLAINFINGELVKSGLMEKISNSNNEVVSILNDIKFLSSNSSYFTGFFSSEFSAEDKLR
jgi:hypothetical protein